MMESPFEIKPQLDKQQMFWKNLQVNCLQAFTLVRLSANESQWHFLLCKFHTYENLLCKVVINIKESDFIKMKRRQEEEEPRRYIFVVDAVLRNQQFTLEKVQFLKQINLEGFVTKITWGVLHEVLCETLEWSTTP
jgi:hypothetical protein